MKKLKNCYYKKVKSSYLIQGHHFIIYDKDKNFVARVLSWDTVLIYDKYGVLVLNEKPLTLLKKEKKHENQL